MIADLLAAQSALVVAPHPDDEALGCGGLLAALADHGARLAVLFVTDGGASHPGSRKWPGPRLAALRAEEAAASLAALGAADATRLHLGLPDAGIVRGDPGWQRAVARTADLAAGLRPALVLAPWRRDPHRDHVDAHALIVEALQRARLRPRLLEYPIWLDELAAEDDRPRPGETLAHHVDVSPWRERKQEAVAAHRSQLGLVIDDDPGGFVLTGATVRRLTSGDEVYFEVQA
jgi:LmbE family N-acetylglucosaminyl deacetylase